MPRGVYTHRRSHPLKISCITANNGPHRQLQAYFSDELLRKLGWAKDMEDNCLYLRCYMSASMEGTMTLERVPADAPGNVQRVKVTDMNSRSAPPSGGQLRGGVSFNLSTWFGPTVNFELFNSTPVSHEIKEVKGQKVLIANTLRVLSPCKPPRRAYPAISPKVQPIGVQSADQYAAPKITAEPAAERPAMPPKMGLADTVSHLNHLLAEASKNQEDLSVKVIVDPETKCPRVRIERLAVYE